MLVYKAIAAVQGELATVGIGKDRKNEQQGYKFRGIDDVYNELAPFLAKHGLCVLPRCLSREVTERLTKTGGTLFYITVAMEFDFVCAEDWSKHTVGPMYGEAMDSGDKATNKAMSAAYKYACMQAFCIPTEGDNDADAKTHEVIPKPVTAPPTVPPATTDTKDAEYHGKIKEYLHAIYGADRKAALDKVEELTAFVTRDGKAVAGVRDFTKLTGKRVEILSHSLAKLVPKEKKAPPVDDALFPDPPAAKCSDCGGQLVKGACRSAHCPSGRPED